MPSMKMPVNTARVAGETFRARNTVPFALAMAAVGLFSFLSGGYVIGRSTPIAVALLCASAVWVWFLRRSSRPPALFLAALCVFTAFTVWSGLSVLWSYGPDLTWVAFNLTAFYLAVVAVLGLTSVRGLQLRTVGYGYLVVATSVGVYAFLGKGLPDVVTHAHTHARLDSPVGYWNVLALMMVMGVCVALAVAGDRGTPAWLRTLAAAAAAPMCLVFFFTLSRGGWLVLGLALVLYFVFTTTRLGSFVSLAAIVAPVALVLWRLRGLETLFIETTDDALRTLQGHTLLRWAVAALLVTVGVQLAAALVQGSVRWPRWSTFAAGVAVLAVLGLVVIGGSGTYLQRHGGVQWVKDKAHALVTDAETEEGDSGASRLFTVTTNGRIPLWREAVEQSQYVRQAGTGAGTFAFSHYRFRAFGGVVKHAHGQWVNVLSELGIVGLALFVAAVVLFVAAAVGNPFSRRDDPLHPLLVSLQVGAIAFFVHMSWDWDWDMAAAGMLAFVFVAAAVSYRGTRAADDRRRARRAEHETRVFESGRAADVVAEEREAGATAAAAKPEAALVPGAERTGAVALDAHREAGIVLEEAVEEAGVAGGGGDVAAPAEDYLEDSDLAVDGGETRRRPRRPRVGWSVRVVASAALLLLAACWLPPYLAQRAESAALAEAGDGRVEAALAHARRAARIDPLAVSPLLTEASLLQQLGQNRAALAKLEEAARLQPQNYEVWFALGELQAGALGRVKDAEASFTRALALNPSDTASRYELERLAH
jgi:O-antigen ligase